MHGIIFFFLHKYAERFPTVAASWSSAAASSASQSHLPSGVYPDADAVAMLGELADTSGRPLGDVVLEFGEFLAPHLLKVAAPHVETGWKTLDVIEHTESLIHTMVRATNPGATPPVLETFRASPDELHVVYSSKRRLCGLATGLIRGLARHFDERIHVDEPSCMHRGAPFCSFVVRREHGDTHPSHAPTEATLISTGHAEANDPGIVFDDVPPTRIGDYRVLGTIGTGAMGRVYLADDERLDRRVAIKVMNARYAGNPAARQRFLRESRSVAAVEHPHVMTIHQVGEQDGIPYIVMQLLEGRTLRAHRDASGPLPLADVLRIGREIAEGLAAAHRRGLVHRDIKPANIFLEGDAGNVRIIDFGLARTFDTAATAVTHDGALVGTPSYMPPEGIDGGEIDARSDLFGLGVILYELLANRLPFEGRTVAAVLTAIAAGRPEPLSAAAPDVPTEVCRLVMRLIAHAKADRPTDTRSVATELAALEKRHAG